MNGQKKKHLVNYSKIETIYKQSETTYYLTTDIQEWEKCRYI